MLMGITKQDFIMLFSKALIWNAVVTNINEHRMFLDIDDIQSLLLNKKIRIKNENLLISQIFYFFLSY